VRGAIAMDYAKAFLDFLGSSSEPISDSTVKEAFGDQYSKLPAAINALVNDVRQYIATSMDYSLCIGTNQDLDPRQNVDVPVGWKRRS
jgi:hypothetical protein